MGVLTEAIDMFRLAESQAGDVDHLHIFDMDGTLALSPEPSPENKKRVPGRGWWSNPASLNNFDVKPVPEVKARYDAVKGQPGHHVAVMTGREDTPAMRAAVDRTLHGIGVRGHVHGHDLFLNPGADTKEWKKGQIMTLIKHHRPRHVHIYDDRHAHADEFSKMLGSLKIPHTIYKISHPDWKAGDKMPETS